MGGILSRFGVGYSGGMVTVAEEYMPLTLYVPGMTDEQFREFCEQYSDFSLEYSAEGDLIVMPPTDPDTGSRNARIIGELYAWAKQAGFGIVIDSSTGYVLSHGARRSPDAAWTSRARHMRRDCPEFIIELLSPFDRPRLTRAKMREWIENGAQLGWMIDCASRTVTVFRAGQEPEEIRNAESIAGEGPVAGFVLDLEALWSI